MKDQYLHIDEIFKRKFEGFEPEPPAGMWPKIKARLSGTGGTGIGAFKTILLSSVVLVTAGALVLMLLTNSQPTSNIDNNLLAQNKTINTSSDYQNDASIPVNDNQINTPTPVDNTKTVISENKKEPITQKEIIEPKITQVTAASTEIQDNTSEKNTWCSNILSLQKHSTNLIPVNSDDFQLHSASNRIPDRFNFKFDPEQKTTKSAVESYFKIGGFINPEVVFYPDDSVSNSRNFNFGLDIRYHKKNFFIKTGLGISIARDEGKYNINYKQLEYLGSYQDVYNVTFDTTESGVEPIYHTKTVMVYDSVEHATVSKEKNTYTYIQIPLMFGYQIERPKVNYSIMAGPCFSAMINKNIPDPAYPENARILNITSDVAERISTNWQMVLGVGINYKLSKKWELSLEPTKRYYLNSAYRRDIITTKHPYSIGLRAGLLFKLQ